MHTEMSYITRPVAHYGTVELIYATAVFSGIWGVEYKLPIPQGDG